MRESSESYVTPFRKGLGEAGYVEGRNVAIEFRYADTNYDRLPALMADPASTLRKAAVMAGIGQGRRSVEAG